VAARDSRILSVVKTSGDPGLLEVVLESVTFSADTAEITITARVDCPSYASVVFVDITVDQARGSGNAESLVLIENAACNQPFTTTVTGAGLRAFGPGLATIEIDAFVCGFGCAGEGILATVVLIPD